MRFLSGSNHAWSVAMTARFRPQHLTIAEAFADGTFPA